MRCAPPAWYEITPPPIALPVASRHNSLPVDGVVGEDLAIEVAGEHQAARRRRDGGDHGLGRLDLPGHGAALGVEGGDPSLPMLQGSWRPNSHPSAGSAPVHEAPGVPLMLAVGCILTSVHQSMALT